MANNFSDANVTIANNSLTDIFTSDGIVIGFLAKREMIKIR